MKPPQRLFCSVMPKSCGFFFWIVLDSYLRTKRDASFWTPPAVGGAIMEFFFLFLFCLHLNLSIE